MCVQSFWVCSSANVRQVNARPLSFQTGAALCDRLSQLPNPGPGWMAKELIPNNGTPSDPVILFYRDPVDIVKMFLSSPSFSEHLDFAPSCMWEDENMESRLYNEISTGDWWWRTQVSGIHDTQEHKLTCSALGIPSRRVNRDSCSFGFGRDPPDEFCRR